MPGFGLLPTPAFPPLAQPAVPPAVPGQPPFQAPFQAPSEPLAQKAHQVELCSWLSCFGVLLASGAGLVQAPAVGLVSECANWRQSRSGTRQPSLRPESFTRKMHIVTLPGRFRKVPQD